MLATIEGVTLGLGTFDLNSFNFMRSNRSSIAARSFPLWIGLLMFAGLICRPVYAQRIDSEIQTLRAILSKPDAEIDLARAKLTIDRMVDPSIDIEANLKKLDAMAAAVRISAGPQAPSLETVSVLRSYLYDAGTWNNQQPFHYDLEGDPQGRKTFNRLLPNYLTTKKGNCVSMPTLFVLLAQKLGLDATFAQTPNHFFVKYRDETGRSYNVETTSGGYPRRDELYQRDTPMTPLALKNGIYMRPLNKKEAVVAAMLGVLIDHYKDQGKPERVIPLAELALEYYPKNANAMLDKGYAYFMLLKREFLQKYPTSKDIPIEARARFEDLARNNRDWYAKAEALGWREPDADADARYLQIVKNIKPN